MSAFSEEHRFRHSNTEGMHISISMHICFYQQRAPSSIGQHLNIRQVADGGRAAPRGWRARWRPCWRSVSWRSGASSACRCWWAVPATLSARACSTSGAATRARRRSTRAGAAQTPPLPAHAEQSERARRQRLWPALYPGPSSGRAPPQQQDLGCEPAHTCWCTMQDKAPIRTAGEGIKLQNSAEGRTPLDDGLAAAEGAAPGPRARHLQPTHAR